MVSTDRDTLPKVYVLDSYTAICSSKRAYVSNISFENNLTNTTRAKPVNYHVSLSDLKLGSPWTYRGLVKIDLQILTPSTEITLNCNEVEVHKADILKKDGTEIHKCC